MKQLKMWTSESFTFSSLNTTSMPITDLTTVIFLSVNFPHCLRIFKIAFLSFTLCVCVCVCVCSSLKCTQFLKKSIQSLCEKWKDFSSELRFCFMVGFPCDSAGKESACNGGDLGLIPGLGRFPGEGKGYYYPLPYSGLENRMDYIVLGVAKELDTTEWLSLFFFFLSRHQCLYVHLKLYGDHVYIIFLKMVSKATMRLLNRFLIPKYKQS